MDYLTALKFRTSTLIIMLIIILSLLFYFTYSPSPKRDFPKASDIVKNGQILPKKKLQKLTTELSTLSLTQGTQLMAVISPTPTPLSHDEPSLFDICKTSWGNFAQRQIVDLQNDILKERLLVSLNCLQRMKKEVQLPQIQRFIEHCQTRHENMDILELEQICFAELPEFRTYIFRRLGQNNQGFEKFDSSHLANQLLGGFLDLKNASLADLNQNIAIAEALIARDPNIYAAYKGKLLSLLMKELKFKQTVDISIYEDLYGELLNFRRLNEKDQILVDIQASSESTQSIPDASELLDIDSDLIQIPFLRLKALGNSEGLAEMAQEYIDAFPNSYLGYMYLADVVWSTGEKARAVNIFKTAPGNLLSDEAAFEFMRHIESKSAIDYVTEMKLE